MKVAKFGGSSLASAEQIKKVCDIVLQDPERRLIVVSAPGKRSKEDIKVTDLLIRCAEAALSGGPAEKELTAVVKRFEDIAYGLGLDGRIVKNIEDDLRKRLEGKTGHRGMFIDCLKAAGEDNCARLVAEYLKNCGINAYYVNPGDAGMLLSDEFGNARVLPESYENLARLREKEGIMVFPGFFGYSRSGDVVTFPRGGSDITGSILTAAVEAELYENFTDVDSVFSADPNIVSNPQPVKELTYREMRELSYAGFSVLHEDTLEPVYRKGIPVCIRNTNNPASPGTLITTRRRTKNGPVVGIAGDSGFCSIYIGKYMMNREIGFGRKVFQILEEESLSFEHAPSGIDNICVILRERQMDGATEEKVVRRLKDELNADDVSVEHDMALVMIVGEGMMHTVGIASRATKALADARVNIAVINQGASEVSIMFGFKAEDAVNAIRALYNEFFGR